MGTSGDTDAELRHFYSQFGEDRRLDQIFAGKTSGRCVEIGANDGVSGSNTLFFEKLGWDCILVEPNPELCRAMRGFRRAHLFEGAASDRNGTTILNIAVGTDGAHAMSAIGADGRDQIQREHGLASRPVEVDTRRLDDILDQASAVAPLDFVSIDVEGHELSVLRGFSLTRWRPRVVLIEDNRSASADVHRHMLSVDYLRFDRTGVNDWYAHATDPVLATRARRRRYHFARLAAQLQFAQIRLRLALRRVPGVLPIWEWSKLRLRSRRNRP